MNRLIAKIGLDKFAHLGIGGLICALFTFVVILQDADILLHGSNIWRALLTPFIGTVVVMVFELSLIGKTYYGLSSDACWCLRQSEWGYCFMCYQTNK